MNAWPVTAVLSVCLPTNISQSSAEEREHQLCAKNREGGEVSTLHAGHAVISNHSESTRKAQRLLQVMKIIVKDRVGGHFPWRSF